MNVRFLSILSLLASLPLSVFAQQTPQSLADAELPSLLGIYKDLHSHPELSGYEERTAASVAKELRAAGCQVTEHLGKYDNSSWKCYGVVGVMKNGAGPTVLVRTDLDALPVQEDTGLPYASTVTTKTEDGKEVPVMHACGHDAHMAMFIGVARALAKLKDQWHGTIVFVAQPAEETGNGARALLHAGLYEKFGKPDFALGFHDNAQMQTGHIGVTEGYTYANVDSVDVTVRGVGGHGAYPHKTKDPIVLSAEMINAWQTIVSRENNPVDPVVITVGSIHGGTQANVIPDEVRLQLSVRTYTPEVRRKTLAAIRRIARGEAISAGAPREPEVITPGENATEAVVYNDPALTARLAAALKAALGDKTVVEMPAKMTSEDFAQYWVTGKVPSALLHIGAVNAAKFAEIQRTGVPGPAPHSPEWVPDRA